MIDIFLSSFAALPPSSLLSIESATSYLLRLLLGDTWLTEGSSLQNFQIKNYITFCKSSTLKELHYILQKFKIKKDGSLKNITWCLQRRLVAARSCLSRNRISAQRAIPALEND